MHSFSTLTVECRLLNFNPIYLFVSNHQYLNRKPWFQNSVCISLTSSLPPSIQPTLCTFIFSNQGIKIMSVNVCILSVTARCSVYSKYSVKPTLPSWSLHLGSTLCGFTYWCLLSLSPQPSSSPTTVLLSKSQHYFITPTCIKRRPAPCRLPAFNF